MVSWHERPPVAVAIAIAAVALALIGTVDAVTGHEVHFSFLYLFPLALVALRGSRALAWIFCVAAAALWYLAELASAYEYAHPLIPAWNSVVRFGTYSVVTFLLRRLREDLRVRAVLVAELRESLANVSTLSGLLPICAWCKNVRNDAGYWQRVESYIQEHTDATFTHGICPSCSAKLEASEDANAAPAPHDRGSAARR
jgi:hypothetical protein